MAILSEERASPRSFGPWNLSAMVGTTGKRRGVQVGGKNPRLIEMSVHFDSIARLVQSEPFG